MNQICKRSGLSFQITDLEQSYCEQRGIPLAEISPQERMREMFAFRNETMRDDLLHTLLLIKKYLTA
jgi:hypothetical protein